MDSEDVGRSVNAHRLEEDSFQRRSSPFSGMVSVDAEVLAESMALHDRLLKLADKIEDRNRWLLEERRQLEWRVLSFQRRVADLKAELRQIRLNASNDRVSLELSWQDMHKYKKESEKYQKRAIRAETESARHAKKLEETIAKMEALVEDLSSSEKKRLALKERVTREYPGIDLSFLEAEEFHSPLLAVETRAAGAPQSDISSTAEETHGLEG